MLKTFFCVIRTTSSVKKSIETTMESRQSLQQKKVLQLYCRVADPTGDCPDPDTSFKKTIPTYPNSPLFIFQYLMIKFVLHS